MRLARIRPVQQLRHGAFPVLSRRSRDRIIKRLVKAHRVRHRSGIPPSELQITEIVHGHAGDDDEDVIVAERRQRLAELVVLDWIFCFEEGDLDDGDGEGVGGWVEG